MTFDHLGGFFDRFKNIKPPDETVRKAVVDFVQEEFGKDIEIKKISVRNSCIYTQCSPGLKNALFLNKQKLIRYIQEKTNTTISDVR